MDSDQRFFEIYLRLCEEKNGIEYTVFEDVASKLVDVKNDALFQGTNGIFDDEFYHYLDFVQYRIFDLLDFVNPAERIAFRCIPCDGHDKKRDYSDVNQ